MQQPLKTSLALLVAFVGICLAGGPPPPAPPPHPRFPPREPPPPPQPQQPPRARSRPWPHPDFSRRPHPHPISDPHPPSHFGDPLPPPIGGIYIEPDEHIQSPTGEIVIDHETGVQMPEEANDGELEGGEPKTAWTYNDQNGWVVEYPECVGKHLRQSPIDIVTSDVIFNPRMQLQFVDYDQDVEFEYKNTHHSVSLTPIPAFATPSIKVNWVSNGKPDEYELQEIHFHWGHGGEKGSEHEINDQRAAAEMHMVHYRKGLSKDQIGSVDNSVVVIGVFIESDDVEHNKLETLVKRAGNVNGTDAQYRATSPDNLIHLLPDNHHSFYTYNGSLTTPPCYEVVTWILMSEPVYMCQEQLEELSNLEANKPGVGRQKINANHREIQPLLLRPVYASFNTTESVSFDQDRIGKRIGIPGHPLADSLSKFWGRVNKVKVSVRRAYNSINRARRSLIESFARLRSRAESGAPAPAAGP